MSGRSFGLAAALLLVALAVPGDAIGSDAKGSAQADAAAEALPPDVLDTTWEWIWFGSGAEEFDVEAPERYTVAFSADGKVAIQVDCNRGVATYELGPDGTIELSPIGVTMMLCEDDQLGDRFVKSLEQVRLHFEKDGDFVLEAPISSGTLRFRRQAEDGG